MTTIIFRQEQKYSNVTLIVFQAVKSDQIPRVSENIWFGYEMNGDCKEIRHVFSTTALLHVKAELEPLAKNVSISGYDFVLNGYTELSLVQGLGSDDQVQLLVTNPSELLGNQNVDRTGFFCVNTDGSNSDVFDIRRFDDVYPY